MLNKENLTDANIFSWYKFANLYKKYKFLPQNHILKLDEIIEISGSNTGIWKHENSMVIVSEKFGSWNIQSVTSEWSWLTLFVVKFGASSSDTKHISEDTVRHCLRTNRVRHSTQDCYCFFHIISIHFTKREPNFKYYACGGDQTVCFNIDKTNYHRISLQSDLLASQLHCNRLSSFIWLLVYLWTAGRCFRLMNTFSSRDFSSKHAESFTSTNVPPAFVM